MTTGSDRLAEWGIAGLPFPGTASSGDRHVVQPFDGGLLAAAVDGLGHGPEAAAAAELAVATLAASPAESLPVLIRRCHARLGPTRGVAVSLASIEARTGMLSWLGIGNVEGVLIRGSAAGAPERTALITQPGVVGYTLPQRLKPAALPVWAGDVLAFATDGVDPRGLTRLSPLGPPGRIAERLLAGHARGSDDALVLVLRYLGARR